MDANDIKTLLNENIDQLNQILNNCQNNSTELTLLATKFGPLLDDFSATEEELFSSLTDIEPIDDNLHTNVP